jgi:hypothetical protein
MTKISLKAKKNKNRVQGLFDLSPLWLQNIMTKLPFKVKKH